MYNLKTEKNSDVSSSENKSGLSVRLAALRFLSAVIDKKQPLDALVDHEHGHPHYLSLSTADRLLLRAILSSSLRHRAEILQIVDLLIHKNLPKGATALQHLLTISLAQLLYLNVPDYAVINSAVNIAKKDPRLSRFSSLINAILRNFCRGKDKLTAKLAPQDKAPSWLRQELESFYGVEKSNLIFYRQTLEPSLDITVKSNPTLWAEKLEALLLPNGSLRLLNPHQDITKLPGFSEGEWWVQDFSAAIPATLLGDIKDKNIADLCSAPGGKTAQLISQGAKVTAVDISANRLNRLKKNLDRLSYQAEYIVADLRKFTPKQIFDGILIDAPCSSTGTIRRHPDILWTKNPEDITKISQIQFELLEASFAMVKKGGVIVFSNCSILPEEGEKLVTSILDKYSDIIKLEPFQPNELPDSLHNLITTDGCLRTTPADFHAEDDLLSGMDGFFAARFKLK